MTEGHRPTAGKSEKVRALTRGLEVLRHVNRMGACRTAEISDALGIPRPTVYRLLETLEQEGYVAFSSTSNRVRVTRLAASLGDGFAMTSQICQAAGPLFAEYAPRIVWPLDISIYDNAAMVIQETTHGRSPLSIDRGMIGFRLPMLRTSAGRCYLGLCPPTERELILEHIRRLDDPSDAAFLDDRYLIRILEQVSERRLAIRDGGEFRPKTSSFAVPVMSSGRIVACMSMIWTKGAMKTSEALRLAEEPMRAISNRISLLLDD